MPNVLCLSWPWILADINIIALLIVIIVLLSSNIGRHESNDKWQKKTVIKITMAGKTISPVIEHRALSRRRIREWSTSRNGMCFLFYDYLIFESDWNWCYKIIFEFAKQWIASVVSLFSQEILSNTKLALPLPFHL